MAWGENVSQDAERIASNAGNVAKNYFHVRNVQNETYGEIMGTVAETFAGGVVGVGGNLVSSAVDAGISQTIPSQVNRRYIGSGMKYNGRTG